jgi:predicted nuclease with TOPRIM domain
MDWGDVASWLPGIAGLITALAVWWKARKTARQAEIDFGLAARKADLETLREIVITLREELARSQCRQGELETELEETRAKLDDYQGKLEKAQAEITALQSKLHKSDLEMNRLRRRVQELERENKALRCGNEQAE